MTMVPRLPRRASEVSLPRDKPSGLSNYEILNNPAACCVHEVLTQHGGLVGWGFTPLITALVSTTSIPETLANFGFDPLSSADLMSALETALSVRTSDEAETITASRGSSQNPKLVVISAKARIPPWPRWPRRDRWSRKHQRRGC
jgi:hypothetical protein